MIKLPVEKEHTLSTDRWFELPSGSFSWKDGFSEELKRLTDIQLKDTSVWKLFTELFKHPGIDDADHGWRCEYWGKMMRGGCFTYKVTGDKELYGALEATVRDMLTAQCASGRFSTYSEQAEFHGWDIWGRKYILLGMEYFLEICSDRELSAQVLKAMKEHTDYMADRFGDEKDGKICIATATDHWDGLNSCSLLEPVMFLYNLTKEEKYLTFAEYILSFGGTCTHNLFDLAEKDELPVYQYHVTKAYEMISCFEGLAEYNKVKPSEKHTRALKSFADRVMKEENTVIGCLGCNFESFDHAAEEQFNALHKGIMQETCVTVTWMKFLWQMFRITGETKYMDAFEVSAYNAMSAALRKDIDLTTNGGVPLPVHSYNPLTWDTRPDEIGGRKNITENSVYGCCVCISSCGYALEGLSAVCTDKNGNILVNLYRNGLVYTPDAALRITTDYPKSGRVTIELMKHRGDFSLSLRIPAWTEAAAVSVNGQAVAAVPGNILTVNRPWRDGDRINVEFAMKVRLIKPSDFIADTDVKDRFALAYGPVVFAADGTKEEEPQFSKADIKQLLASEPVFSPEKQCRAEISFCGKDYRIIDYSSAGQIKGHKLSCWMKKA